MKVGVVGGGQIAAIHIPYIRSISGTEIVGLTDSNEVRARETAARFGINKAYRTLGELLETNRPDVVHILTPPQTHAALAIQAMEAGCHVLVEKPMAVNLEEAEAMEAAAGRHGVKLCIDHNHLFDPAVVQARAMVAQGIIGEIVSVEAFEGFSVGAPDNPYVQPGSADHWVHRLPGASSRTWRRTGVPDAGVPRSAEESHAVARRRDGYRPRSRTSRVLATSDNGIGCFMVSLSIQPFMKYVHVYGTEGTIRVNLTTNGLTLIRNRELPRALARGMLGIDEATQLVRGTVSNAVKVATGRLRSYPGLGILINEFYRSIDENRPAPVDGEAGREVVRVLDMVWEQIGPWSKTALAGQGGQLR
jgi:predicted dehydrogenase